MIFLPCLIRISWNSITRKKKTTLNILFLLVSCMVWIQWRTFKCIFKFKKKTWISNFSIYTHIIFEFLIHSPPISSMSVERPIRLVYNFDWITVCFLEHTLKCYNFKPNYLLNRQPINIAIGFYSLLKFCLFFYLWHSFICSLIGFFFLFAIWRLISHQEKKQRIRDCIGV